MGRRRKGEAVSGWICLDKPYDLTSTQAVGKVRRIFNAQKAGHAGTLDPLATGVLPLQVPPIYSAIKVDGERAYDLARAGEEVELKARPVMIHGLAVGEAPDADHIELIMDCGKGAYVRSVVRDLALRLGAEAHVSALRRTRVGAFTEARAIGLDLLEELGHKARQSEALLPVETALDDIPALAVTDEDAFRLKQGRSIVLVPRQVETLRAGLAPGARTVSAMCRGVMVALCEMRAGKLEPSRVFHLE